MALTDGLVSYWNLTANSNDSVGSNNGTNTDISFTSSGTIGTAAEFNGSSSQINFGNDSSLTLASGGSVSLWVDSDNVSSGYRTFIEKGAKNTSYQTYQNADFSPARIAARSRQASPDSQITNPSSMSTGTAYHVVYTFQTGDMKLYVNGSLVASGSGEHLTNSGDLCMGYPASGGSSGNRFDGHINKVGLWNRILSAGEVTELYNSGSGLTYPWATLPTVTTDPATDITATSATGNGEVTDDGGADITRRGFVFGTTSAADPGNVSPEDQTEYEYFVAESGTFGEEAFDLTLEKNYG